jgi:hypothetical protein
MPAFEHFDRSAVAAVLAAHDESVVYGDGVVDCAHLLLGALSAPASAAAAGLRAAGVEAGRLRAAVADLPCGPPINPEHLVFSSDVVPVFRAAVHEALEFREGPGGVTAVELVIAACTHPVQRLTVVLDAIGVAAGAVAAELRTRPRPAPVPDPHGVELLWAMLPLRVVEDPPDD